MNEKRRAAVLELTLSSISKKIGLPPNVRVVGVWTDPLRPGRAYFTIEGENEGLPMVSIEGATLQVVSMETETRFR